MFTGCLRQMVSYTGMIVRELAWVDSILVVLDEWLSYRGVCSTLYSKSAPENTTKHLVLKKKQIIFSKNLSLCFFPGTWLCSVFSPMFDKLHMFTKFTFCIFLETNCSVHSISSLSKSQVIWKYVLFGILMFILFKWKEVKN